MLRENLLDLYAFVAVSNERSFTRAAAKIGVSPSALSHTIRALETRLGVLLLTRTTRSVAPTKAGLRLLRQIEPNLKNIEDELRVTQELRDVPAGVFRITAIDYVVDIILLPKVVPLIAQYSEIKIDISVDYGQSTKWCLRHAKEIGPSCYAAIHAMFADRVLIRMRAVQGVLRLKLKYGATRLEAACSRANHYGTPTYQVIRTILEKGLDQQALIKGFDALAATYTEGGRFCRNAQTIQ